MIFDTHAHYDDPRFDADRDTILMNLASAGVGCVVDVSAEFSGIDRVLALADRYPFVYASVGVHPSDTALLTEGKMDILREYAANAKVVAVGEIGLDYHYRLETDPGEADPPREVQKKWFRRQLQMAEELNLPVIIHSRDASQDTLQIMREAHASGITGVIHCYSGSAETAREYLKMDYYLGIGGVVTFKNGKTLREVVREAPLEKLLLETDCPYLAPEPHRGQRNESGYLDLVAEEIARIKGIDKETVIGTTAENAERFYHIGKSGEVIRRGAEDDT